MSLRARVLLGMAVIGVVLAVAAAVITSSTRDHLIEQIDARLVQAGPQLRNVLAGPDAPHADGAAPPRLSDIYVGVLGPGGVLTTVHQPDLRGDTSPLPVVGEREAASLRSGRPTTVGTQTGSHYRLMARSEGPRAATIVIGLLLDDAENAVRRLVAIGAVAMVVVLGVLGLVSWWVIHLGVRPVRRMTDTAEAIAAGDLSQRVVEGTRGTEAGALGLALNRMLERIEEAFRLRDASDSRLRRFVADASHELRTPVTTIRGYAELYRSGGLEDVEELSEAMRRTEQEALRMGALVDDLLRLARLDEGRSVPTTEVDLAALAADAVLDTTATAPNRSVVIDAPGPALVQGDEDGLRQVVANLVSNALVHAPEAAVAVSVRVDGQEVLLEVTDDGPGMSEADAARAFERFYRADASRSRNRGGSGLGLAIVDVTVRAHGGEVRLDSSPGSGTRVQVRLPVSPR